MKKVNTVFFNINLVFRGQKIQNKIIKHLEKIKSCLSVHYLGKFFCTSYYHTDF